MRLLTRLARMADRWQGRRYARQLGYDLPAEELFDRLYDPDGPRGRATRESG